jgi:hypothetical protein
MPEERMQVVCDQIAAQYAGKNAAMPEALIADGCSSFVFWCLDV